ncbi:MAG TPA: IclR family transcriptional regulator [Bryobacteraceae bacterium]|nr:IclR family transcriptional regulator [Bryobacteraceae bacterium]
MGNQSALVPPTIYRIQVLDRVFRILDILADGAADTTLSEIAAALGLHKSTVHRLLMVLESARFVERNAGTGKYHLGSRVIELGFSAASRLDVYDVARPHLHWLVEETGETAHLAVLRDGEVVSLSDVESRQMVRTPANAGSRTPAHCTALGKAILAFTPPEQIAQFLRGRTLRPVTGRTITSASGLRAELRAVRARGYAVDDEEWEPGLRCIGAPVRDGTGAVIAAISISGPVFRIDQSRLLTLANPVMRAANRVSSSLGYRGSTGNGST